MSKTPLSVARKLVSAFRRGLARQRYRRALERGNPAGDYINVSTLWERPDPPCVEVRVRGDGPNAVSEVSACSWCEQQTLSELVAVGYGSDGRELWRVTADDTSPATAPVSWFAAPGLLPGVTPAHLESCLLVAAAEAVDAVVLRDGLDSEIKVGAEAADAAHGEGLRPWALYRTDAYGWDPATDSVYSRRTGRLLKLVDFKSFVDPPRTSEYFGRFRRGPYLSDVDLGPTLNVPLRDAALLGRRPAGKEKPAVLVLVPFLARGGAEHTLFETMRALTDRFDFAIATLAPHRPHLGDRREDFRHVTDRLYCLGDLVHPDAMVGMLGALLDSLGAEIVYNANSTTLFYDFAPRLKEDRPELRIIDHLYDHRVGYIDRYKRSTLEFVDTCVAENNRIAEVLTGERTWPSDRVSVIWPCGRASETLPEPNTREETRRRLRTELGLSNKDLLFLSAARMHPQKRPLDLVALADRTRDLDHVHYLMVGGGDLEDQVDAAIKKTEGVRIRRLHFRTDIPELILAADIGVLVSDFEGLPVFLLECLQLGRPFLGTRVGDLGQVLDETGAGIVVERPGDLEALEAAVRALDDPGLRAEFAENANRAAPRFGVEACAEAYARVFSGAR